jgi:hypothetical protein
MRPIMLMRRRIALCIRAIYPKTAAGAIWIRSREGHPIFMGLRKSPRTGIIHRLPWSLDGRPVMNDQPKWKYVASIYLKRKHILIFRDNVLGLQMQVVSRASNPGSPSRKLYFLDGDNRAYGTESELTRALANGPERASAGLHPLYVQCVPGSANSESAPPDPAPRIPTLLQQGHRWLAARIHRLGAQALQAGYRFPLHRPTR